jgi:hypothetical protein
MRKFGWPLHIILVGAVSGSVGEYLRPVCAQDLSSDLELLVRMKSHMGKELSNLPNYTCLETVTRFHREPIQHLKRPKLEPLDTVLLEVVYSNHQEFYGTPGDRKLSVADPSHFVGSGMMGNGAYATTLRNALEAARVTFVGGEPLGGRTAAKYDFRLLAKALQISIPGGVGKVGEEGSFWVDPTSLDLIRLDARAIDIPAYLPLEETSMQVNYARMQLGESNALLPQQADLHMVQTTGVEDYDRMEFTHCRAFSTQSTIHFDSASHDLAERSPSDGVRLRSAEDATVGAVPPFLLITLQLTTPITNKDTVGKAIEAKVSGDVVRKRMIIVRNGSLVRGRIRRLERYQGGGGADYIVGLEFTQVEAGDGPLRFYADLVRMDKRPEIRPSLSERVLVRSNIGVESKTETITLPELPGVASFFVHGKAFSLPIGFRTVWRTRGLIRQ